RCVGCHGNGRGILDGSGSATDGGDGQSRQHDGGLPPGGIQQRGAGRRWNDGRPTGGVPQGTLAAHQGGTAGRDVYAPTRAEGRDTEAERGETYVRDTYRGRPAHSAGAAPATDTALRTAFLRKLLRVSAR